jgi:hypothetical protein
VKTNEIIGAWLAGVSIWGLSMLGLALMQSPQPPAYQEPPSRGIMVEDWYAQGFPDDADELEAKGEEDSHWYQEEDDPSDRPRSTVLPPLPSPGRQQGSDNQQYDQPRRQQ